MRRDGVASFSAPFRRGDGWTLFCLWARPSSGAAPRPRCSSSRAQRRLEIANGSPVGLKCLGLLIGGQARQWTPELLANARQGGVFADQGRRRDGQRRFDRFQGSQLGARMRPQQEQVPEPWRGRPLHPGRDADVRRQGVELLDLALQYLPIAPAWCPVVVGRGSGRSPRWNGRLHRSWLGPLLDRSDWADNVAGRGDVLALPFS
jgi:hypothetical protein